MSRERNSRPAMIRWSVIVILYRSNPCHSEQALFAKRRVLRGAKLARVARFLMYNTFARIKAYHDHPSGISLRDLRNRHEPSNSLVHHSVRRRRVERSALEG